MEDTIASGPNITTQPKSILHRKQSISLSTVLLLIANIFKNMSMFITNMVIAAVFGASYLTDAFFLAFLLTVRIGIVMTGSIHFTFIPRYAELRAKRTERDLTRLTNAFFNNILLCTAIGTVLFFVFMPWVIRLFCFNADPSVQTVTVNITRALTPTLFFFMAFGLLQALLISNKNFVAPALASLFVPVGLLAGVLLLSQWLGVYGLAVGVVLGTLLQFAFPVPVVRGLGHHYEAVLDWNDPDIRAMRRDSLWIAIIVILGQVVVATDRIFASSLEEGSVSALTYAATLARLVPFLLYFSLLTSAFPTMSEMVAQGQVSELQKLVNQVFRLVGIVMVPVTVVLIVLGYPIVQLLFEHGKFDPRASALTYVAIEWYAIGFLAFALQGPFVQTFFVLKKLHFSVIWSVLTVITNIVLNSVFVKFFGFKGLPFAYTVCMILHLIVCFVAVKVFIKGFQLERAGREFAIMLVSGVLMTIAAKVTYASLLCDVSTVAFLNLVLRIAVPALCSLGVYLISLYLFRSYDLLFLVDKLRTMSKAGQNIAIRGRESRERP